MQDMVSFSFLIYSLATSFFILGGTLFNAIDIILVIGLGMALHRHMPIIIVRNTSAWENRRNRAHFVGYLSNLCPRNYDDVAWSGMSSLQVDNTYRFGQEHGL